MQLVSQAFAGILPRGLIPLCQPVCDRCSPFCTALIRIIAGAAEELYSEQVQEEMSL
jgi:hypothetical protein